MADLEKLAANLEAAGLPRPPTSPPQHAGGRLSGRPDRRQNGGHRRLHDGEGAWGCTARLAAHNHGDLALERRGRTAGTPSTPRCTSAPPTALAETGEIINIDGTGNRVASTLYGHQKVYFLVGVNKIAPDYDAALWRARNIAAPKQRPVAWGAGPPAPPRRTGAMTARARSASAGGLRFFGLVPMPQRRWKSY